MALVSCRRAPEAQPQPDAVPESASAPAALFAPCGTAGDCGRAGGTCLAIFPGGICSRECRTDEECGAGGLCNANLCFPRCTSGGRECDRVHGACSLGARPYCVPSCGGDVACPAGRTCDPYTGRCTDAEDHGDPNGAACDHAHDCRSGRCIPEVSEHGSVHGSEHGSEHDLGVAARVFPGGYCVSFARRPAEGAFNRKGPLPRNGCPPGSALPPLAARKEGDWSPCFQSCSLERDCRAGYRCERFPDATGAAFSDGVCLPKQS